MSISKRLLALVAVLAIVVPACTSDDGGDSTESASQAPSEATTGSGETVTIVASVPPTDHGWLGQIAAKAQEAADQWDDVEFRLVEAADADSQASQIETLINEKPDAIVVLPYDGAALTPVAEKAMEAGIPVVNVDRLFATPEAARATILGGDLRQEPLGFLQQRAGLDGFALAFARAGGHVGQAGAAAAASRRQGVGIDAVGFFVE